MRYCVCRLFCVKDKRQEARLGASHSDSTIHQRAAPDMTISEQATGPLSAEKPSVERVEILLATYNSANYLVPLLDSLLAQTEQDFHLVISDDCSGDATVGILQPYLTAFRHPVQLTVRDTPSGSAMANFAGLMQASTADFVFLCDADDVWDADKLEKFLDAARRKEATLGPEVPLFLFSDARIIDGDGNVSHNSYWSFKKIAPARCLTLQRLLVCPPMLGCASLMNKALVRLACHVPVGRVTGHDWWAILVAGCLGHIDFLNTPTISYRVHGRNSSQPKEVTVRGLGKLAGKVSEMRYEVRRRVTIRQRQAEPLLEQFGQQLGLSNHKIIARFLSVPKRSFLGRRIVLFGSGYTYPDRLRNTALLLFC